MTVNTELKPCPFCGKGDAFVEQSTFASSYVICNDCSARGPDETQDSDDEDEPGRDNAIIAWNTRPTPEPAGDVGAVARAICFAYYKSTGESEARAKSFENDEWPDWESEAQAATAAMLFPAADLAKLREALKPFARAAKWWAAFHDFQRITTLNQHGDCLEVGHLRAAEKALVASTGGEP